MVKIPSHLILTSEQREQLHSLPISEFIDREWEPPKDADPFLKEHDLNNLKNNNPERKWKVRVSNIPKGIRLLQCCCGIDPRLRPKNDNSKPRKSRQIYKFVGCLAFARIKNEKNNCLKISGYLIHSEDCQRQNPRRTNEYAKNDEFKKQPKLWENANNKLQSCEEVVNTKNDELKNQLDLWEASNDKLQPWEEVDYLLYTHYFSQTY